MAMQVWVPLLTLATFRAFSAPTADCKNSLTTAVVAPVCDRRFSPLIERRCSAQRQPNFAVLISAAPGQTLPLLPRVTPASASPVIRRQVEDAYSAARSTPKDAAAVGRLGMVLDAYEQYDSAAVCYERSHLLEPSAFRWLYYLGWVEAAQ